MKLSEDFSPILPKNFYIQDTETIAKQLLGKALSINNQFLCEIVETEAYLEGDRASHSYCGLTKRNWPMFEEGGLCYVYFTYGMYFCMNVVTNKKGVGEAVLIRALKPHKGLEEMKKNRNRILKKEYDLCNGPAKLTQSLKIDLSFTGKNFFDKNFCIVDIGQKYLDSQIAVSKRIGISKDQDKLLRFYIKENKWVSK
jgi:DNA-3-methyladenine glycosylase